VAAIEARFMQGRLRAPPTTSPRRSTSGEKVVVGLNRFTDEEAEPVDVFPSDPALQQNQIASLQKVRAGRDQDGVGAALADLESAARGTQNLLVPMKVALARYATLGEVADVLRAEFGVYQPGG